MAVGKIGTAIPKIWQPEVTAVLVENALENAAVEAEAERLNLKHKIKAIVMCQGFGLWSLVRKGFWFRDKATVCSSSFVFQGSS